MLLRGTVLRNTQFAYGLAVYAGTCGHFPQFRKTLDTDIDFRRRLIAARRCWRGPYSFSGKVKWFFANLLTVLKKIARRRRLQLNADVVSWVPSLAELRWFLGFGWYKIFTSWPRLTSPSAAASAWFLFFQWQILLCRMHYALHYGQYLTLAAGPKCGSVNRRADYRLLLSFKWSLIGYYWTRRRCHGSHCFWPFQFW